MQYIVISLAEDDVYVQATRRRYPTKEAAEAYKKTIDKGRFSVVVPVPPIKVTTSDPKDYPEYAWDETKGTYVLIHLGDV